MCCISLLDLVLADRVADIGWCRERYYSPCSTRFNMVVYQALSVRHSFIFAVAPWNRVTSRGGVLRFQRTDAKRTEIRTVGGHRALLIPPWFIGLALLGANPMNQGYLLFWVPSTHSNDLKS